MVKCVLLNNSDIIEVKFRLNKNIEFADNLLKKASVKGEDFQLLTKYTIKSNFEIHIFGFIKGNNNIINTHYIHNYSEENVVYGDIYACKFNKNNNSYVDLPTKEYEDFYMKTLENSSADNPIDIEESDNDESLDDDDDDELKLLSTVKSINPDGDDCDDNLIDELDILSEVDSDMELYSDDETDLEETNVFIDNNLEPEPYNY